MPAEREGWGLDMEGDSDLLVMECRVFSLGIRGLGVNAFNEVDAVSTSRVVNSKLNVG
jgi:hypothetical protein